MRPVRGAFLVCVLTIWSAAAPAFSQDDAASQDGLGRLGPFELKTEFDIDVAAALGDPQGVRAGPHWDLRLRTEAEAITEAGVRWGLAGAIAARSRDGRRGLQRRGAVQGGQPGLVTGLGGPGLEPESVAGLTRAEVFLKTTLLEVHAGHGHTAAQRERLRPTAALRLTGADGALFDPLGRGIVDTGLSLSAPAPHITVRSRRIVGLAAALSVTPEGDACGVDRCLAADYGDVDDIVSAAVNFDRRMRGSGVRWSAAAGVESGRAVAGPLSVALDDPWLVRMQAARARDGVTVALSAVQLRDGAPAQDYTAWSGHVAVETGDWLLDAALGRAHSDAAARDGWTAQLGASRFVGRRGLAGLALQMQAGDAALVVETGLRF